MKYESGAASNYITRNRALRKLQLSLKDFRRLCILKGIFPHDPLHKKKVNKGSTENRVYYYVKDINYLASEPIISKFREHKIFIRKLINAKAKKEDYRVERLLSNRPTYELQRVVKERYPKFESALRDLDDALCLCFAFAALPHTRKLSATLIANCRRLTAEFNNFIIESHSLTKVFISIKGIYYQAQVKGEVLTWIVGHDRGVGEITEVNFSILSVFAEFYVALLESVNCHLYRSIGLYYPPKLSYSTNSEMDEDEQEKVYGLATPLAKQDPSDELTLPDLNIESEETNELVEKFKDAEAKKKLFVNCWFWLNRETPKEVLALIIRTCGGMVSWENCPGGLFTETDSRITHQIVDRPLNETNISRCYIQPQWVVDCFNLRRRLPVQKYLPGAVLPPHLSPFTDDTPGQYIPEERIEQLKESGAQNLRMREMMIAKKHRRVYHKIQRGIKRRDREIKALKEKRTKLSTNGV
ncbi:unnamed protein product [Enterobius vermicularis]|uniref:Pescadillo homolog n=1 Tax=Enterobius vermicularis TaxID=51028 RepID=A0A0N4UVY1_ENTVE|nr:unnamed protein product [Enterobius vermicularis]